MMLVALLALALLIVFFHTLALALQLSGSLKPARTGGYLCRRAQ